MKTTLKRLPAAGFERVTEAVATEYYQLLELVRQALKEHVRSLRGGDSYVDIRGIWPDRVVFAHDGRTFSHSYTLEKDNTINIGVGEEVVVEYKAVREAAPAPTPTPTIANFTEAADGSIAVTLIRAGASSNRNYYPDTALREATAQFEGARVFVKSDAEHTKGSGKDVRSLIGGIYAVRFIEGQTPDTGTLVGTFKPLDPNDAAVTKMTEAVRRGMTDLLGLSIDAVANTKKRTSGNQVLREAVRFIKVNSVDLIVEPGAGGSLDRLTEAAVPFTTAPATTTNPINNTLTGANMPLWKQRLLEAIYKKDPAQHAKIDAETVADDDLVRLHESICAAPEAANADRMIEAAGTANADNTPVTRAELTMFALRSRATSLIGNSRLPQAAKDRLIARFTESSSFTEPDVATAIKDEGNYIARMTESGAVRMPVFGGTHIEVQDRSLVVRDMLDAFFDPAHKEHRSANSFRECYIEITGDKRVTGRLQDCDQSRLAESLGVFREAIDAGTFGAALGDSITRRMQAAYIGMTDLDAWRKVATVTPVNDFRTQERIRMGGYGNLPIVTENANYTALTSPSDAKANYAVAKRGGTESVTLEAIKNDDVQLLRRIPLELALAAKHTLYEFVFDFYSNNPVIYDGKNLYHIDHKNLFSGALTEDEFAKHRLSMLQQTRAGSSKRLATAPKFLLVPFELEKNAFDLFTRKQNLDKSYVQTLAPEIISVSHWTDAGDWATVGDPQILPVLEIGFLDGREEPELFVQDAPNVGSMFANDSLTYKIRHIYGGNVLVDGYKATTKAVVA